MGSIENLNALGVALEGSGTILRVTWSGSLQSADFQGSTGLATREAIDG